MEKWRKAAETYRQDRIDKKAAEALAAEQKVAAGKATHAEEQAAMARFHARQKRISEDLAAFLKSGNWASAQILLRESGKYITMAIHHDGGGVAAVYILDSDGPKRITEQTGTSPINRESEFIPTTLRELAEAIADLRLNRTDIAEDGSGVVGWITKKLDEIAAKAPQTSS